MDPELQKKLDKWEKNRPENKQYQVLSDLASMTQEMVNVLDAIEKGGQKNAKDTGRLLMDMRERLESLNTKEAPKTPDYAKPVLDGFKDLKAALTAAIKEIDVKPNVNVKAPSVDVSVPDVNVKLDGVEKILKSEIPQAFKDAIKEMPQPKDRDYSEQFKDVLEMLGSIDTASRMKPQFPVSQLNSIKDSIETVAGSTVVFDIKNISPPDDPEIATYKYFGFVQRGSTNWRIMRKTLATNVYLYATGTSGYSAAWSDKDGQSYS